jgi:Uma2 family endonuclease
MSDAARKHMTLGDFLIWEDGTDTRYELIEGWPVATAPSAERHGVLAVRLAARIDGALSARRPCRAVAEAGILDPERTDTLFVVDIGVTCAPYSRRQYVQEILLFDSDTRHAEIHRRRGEQRIIQIITKPDGTIPLSSVGIGIPMAELYEGFTSGSDPET